MRDIKILVCGGRNWADVGTIHNWLCAFNNSDEWLQITLIQGDAAGADTIAKEMAKGWAWEIKSYPADWKRYGRAAGPIRNREMMEEKPDIVLAFHTNLKESKGTKDMVLLSIKEGIDTHLITGKI